VTRKKNQNGRFLGVRCIPFMTTAGNFWSRDLLRHSLCQQCSDVVPACGCFVVVENSAFFGMSSVFSPVVALESDEPRRARVALPPAADADLEAPPSPERTQRTAPVSCPRYSNLILSSGPYFNHYK